MRHRNAVDDECVAPKAFDLEPESLELFAILLERVALSGAEVESHGEKEALRRDASAFQGVHELLVEHALVRRVLVDEHKALLVLKSDVGALELKQWRNLYPDRRQLLSLLVRPLWSARHRKEWIRIGGRRRKNRYAVDHRNFQAAKASRRR